MSAPQPRWFDVLHAEGVKQYATVPREVILQQIATSKCLGERLYFAMVLWSWCGPDPSVEVVRKDVEGWIVRDGRGKPVPARFKDLMSLIGVDPARKGHVSRSAKRLIADELLAFDKGVLRLRFNPTTYKLPVTSTGNFEQRWILGNRVVSIDNLPDDPVTRTEAIAFLDNLSTYYNSGLKDLRTRTDQLLVQGASAVGILIDRSKRSSGVKQERVASVEEAVEPSSSSVSSAATTTIAPQPKPHGQTPAASDVATIHEAMAEHGLGDGEAAKRLMHDVLADAPEATAADIVRIIHAKARSAHRGKNPTGLLLTAVRNAFTGAWRAKAAVAAPALTDEEAERIRREVDEMNAEFEKSSQ